MSSRASMLGLMLAGLSLACSDSDTAARARQETVEAIAALRSYGHDQHEAFRQELDARLSLLDRQLDELKARSARSTADAKAQIEEELAALQAKRSELNGHVSALQQSSKEAWASARDATADSFQSLADGINAAAEKFAQ